MWTRTCRSPNSDISSQGTCGDINKVNLTFASQNCNSLNVSTSCPNQIKKIAAILTLQASIIFLSDIRLNSDKVNIENYFAPSYDLIANSKKSKRGTGILIRNNLNHSVLKEYKDDTGNILGLRISLDEYTLLLISIYGPNNNDDMFFQFLRTILDDNQHLPVIMGGGIGI
jgi:exonuclease III